jgi:adenine-specific DNA glycosylase
MWQLPNVNLEPEESEEAGIARALRAWCGTSGVVGGRVASLQHSVTRYRITVNLFDVTLNTEPAANYCQALVWQDLHELSHLAMPAAHRKLASRVLEP